MMHEPAEDARPTAAHSPVSPAPTPNRLVPEWVSHAVFYQIFPDRFARSTRTTLPAGIQFKPWGTPPEEQGFQGGDLLGIVDRLDYLLDLGINALYLNPVFSSASNHRYHTFDYFTVDPLLGGDDALRELLDAAHANDMKVVIDGVFNHASRGFWPFHHVLETGGNSPYLDWFYVRDWPLVPYPPDGDTDPNYESWWGLPALPKLNVSNPGMRAYLLKAAAHWIKFGADGWRLDVPEEIDDVPFWQAFRRVVRQANPEAYLVGEIWHEADDWLRGDRFDAVMNYVFSRAAFGFFGAETLRTDYRPGGYTLAPLDATAFAKAIDQMCARYDWEIVTAQLNLMDSHDTARVLWTVGEDESAARLCALFQMTMPGAPCIYYGAEIGMTGATDPYCRAAFPWHAHRAWNEDLLDFYRRAIALRHKYTVLRTGSVATIHAQNDIYGMLRTDTELGQGQHALVLFNAGKSTARVDLAHLPPALNNLTFVDVWQQNNHARREYAVSEGRMSGVHIPPRDAAILVPQIAR